MFAQLEQNKIVWFGHHKFVCLKHGIEYNAAGTWHSKLLDVC
jgi:hypothetical protein